MFGGRPVVLFEKSLDDADQLFRPQERDQVARALEGADERAREELAQPPPVFGRDERVFVRIYDEDAARPFVVVRWREGFACVEVGGQREAREQSLFRQAVVEIVVEPPAEVLEAFGLLGRPV